MEYLCDFENCDERKEGKQMITVTNNLTGDKRRFCGWFHAAEFCQKRFERLLQTPLTENDWRRLVK